MKVNMLYNQLAASQSPFLEGRMRIVKLSGLVLVLLIGIFMSLKFMHTPVEYYHRTGPAMSIKEYFSGPIQAWGIVQDWRGRVVRQFDVKMTGTWEGDTGTLTEHFAYYDGVTQERIWTIKKLDNGRYEGTAADILGKAYGQESGNAVKWHYTMDLTVDNKLFRIKFDDWMWHMHDGVLINRSYLKKFGITVAELTIFMQKE